MTKLKPIDCKLIWITISVFFIKLYLYIVRAFNDVGPHNKTCKCSRWGIYKTVSCPNASNQLVIRHR